MNCFVIREYKNFDLFINSPIVLKGNQKRQHYHNVWRFNACPFYRETFSIFDFQDAIDMYFEKNIFLLQNIKAYSFFYLDPLNDDIVLVTQTNNYPLPQFEKVEYVEKSIFVIDAFLYVFRDDYARLPRRKAANERYLNGVVPMYIKYF